MLIVQIFISFPVQIKPNGCNWEESHSRVEGFAVHGVEEQAPLFRIDERPKALGLLDHLIYRHHVIVTLCESPNLHLQVFPLLITVAEEGAKEAGVEVVEHHAQQILVELEGIGELLHHLGNGKGENM